ncbi:ead/Ea22-like family protein, partial [Escherichia coli]
GVDIDALNAFKFLTGPETVLALLDERERNQQHIKSRDQENEDMKWSTKTGHRVRVFSSIDFPIRLVVTHHYI